MKIFSILTSTLILYAGLVGAAKPTLNFKDQPSFALQACEPAPAVDTTHKVEVKGPMRALPSGILVAREAHFSVESRSVEGSLVRVESYQSFINSNLKSKAKILCGSSELPLKARFGMMGPTLIHLGAGASDKNIFWQFQVLADNTLLQPWNVKSLAMSSSGDIEKTLFSLGYKTKIFKLKSNQYEIQYIQKQEDKTQSLNIIYDLD